eukprot:403338795
MDPQLERFMDECQDQHLAIYRYMYMIIELDKKRAVLEKQIDFLKAELLNPKPLYELSSQVQIDIEKLKYMKKLQLIRQLYQQLEAVDDECILLAQKNFNLAFAETVRCEKKARELLSSSTDQVYNQDGSMIQGGNNGGSKQRIMDLDRRFKKLKTMQSLVMNFYKPAGQNQSDQAACKNNQESQTLFYGYSNSSNPIQNITKKQNEEEFIQGSVEQNLVSSTLGLQQIQTSNQRPIKSENSFNQHDKSQFLQPIQEAFDDDEFMIDSNKMALVHQTNVNKSIYDQQDSMIKDKKIENYQQQNSAILSNQTPPSHQYVQENHQSKNEQQNKLSLNDEDFTEIMEVDEDFRGSQDDHVIHKLRSEEILSKQQVQNSNKTIIDSGPKTDQIKQSSTNQQSSQNTLINQPYGGKVPRSHQTQANKQQICLKNEEKGNEDSQPIPQTNTVEQTSFQTKITITDQQTVSALKPEQPVQLVQQDQSYNNFILKHEHSASYGSYQDQTKDSSIGSVAKESVSKHDYHLQAKDIQSSVSNSPKKVAKQLLFDLPEDNQTQICQTTSNVGGICETVKSRKRRRSNISSQNSRNSSACSGSSDYRDSLNQQQYCGSQDVEMD